MPDQAHPRGPAPQKTPLLPWPVRLLVAMAVVLPVSLALWPHLPLMQLPPFLGLALERVLVVLLLLALVLLLLRRLPLASYAVLLVVIGVLTFKSFAGGGGFRQLIATYSPAVEALSVNLNALPAVDELKPFKGAEELRAAMDYKDPVVRSFAVKAATSWFKEEAEGSDRTMVQAFSVFKVINSAWVYVSDPADGEYFATAKESVPLLAGDCDDHAVLMASCIKDIGGRVRLVRTTGHIYPEMCVGDAKGMQRAAWLIRNVLFPNEARYADLYYHTDANGDRWINLDYTRSYPGGPVMNEKIIGILYV